MFNKNFQLKIKDFLSSYLINSFWIILQTIVSFLFSITIFAHAIRVLGADQLGLIEYVKSIVLIIDSVIGLGLENIVIIEMLRDKNHSEEIRSNIISIQVIAAVLSFVGVVLYSFFVKDILLGKVFRMLSFVLLFNPLKVFKELLIAELKSKVYTIASFFGIVVSAIFVEAVLIWKMPIIYYSLTLVWEYFITLIILVLYFFCIQKTKIVFSFRYTLKLLKNAAPFLLSNIAIILYNQMDRIMLKHMLGNREVGIYSIAYNVAVIWQFIPFALVNSMRPVMLKNMEKSSEELKRHQSILVNSITGICVFAMLMVYLLGEKYILWIYKEQYAEAANYLLLLSASVFFSMLGCVGTIWILGLKLNRFSAYRTVAGSVVNIILNYLLIPVWGINGAIVATVFTQFFVSILFLLICSETRCIVREILKVYYADLKYIKLKISK